MDRRTFGRFLGIEDGDRVPDETTIWRFREALVEAGAVERLFARFDAHLKDAGYLAMGGQIVDASIIAAPRQRMTDEEREIIKGGGIPEDWTTKPRKLAQKDRDARWTLKRGRKKRRPDGGMMAEIATPVFGYKSHINVDRRHGLIRKWSVTDAARHDGRLGRYRVPVTEKREAHRTGRAVLDDPLPPSSRQAAEGAASARQRSPLEGPLGGRASLCRAEGQDGALRADDRRCARQGQDRHGQHRIQHEAARIPRTESSRRVVGRSPKKQGRNAVQTEEALTEGAAPRAGGPLSM